ncbi:hypothetical protein [Prevotella sp. KH2C16]|uniref:hypothetical protein n=1 Tax=Prevotella sp. KH2C16 TaxID=1855325 RepID=UPI0008E7F4A2|nr:hypothetical protein [Prevotella sp. KH2C16]SFG65624.1 hypothetical protein SAMN05216383_12624 [Prevotella sp. KH2C16]
MKKTIIYLATAILLAFGSVLMNIVKADNPVNPREAYIRKFYAEYKKALDEEKSQPLLEGQCPYEKSFSIIKKYCTKNFYDAMLRDQEEGDGYDFVTDNLGFDETSLSTMEITYVNEDCSRISYKVCMKYPYSDQSKIYTVNLEIIFIGDKIEDIDIPHDE